MVSWLKTYLIWSGLLFIASEAVAFIIIITLGLNGVFIAAALVTFLAGLFAYLGAMALSKKKHNKKDLPPTVNGVIIVVLSGLIAGIFNFIFTGKLNFNTGILTLVAGAIGGYIVERKTKGTKLFGL